MSARKVYLDHAAATPVDKRVLKAMAPYWQDVFHNPSSIYLDGKKAKDGLQNARKSVALVLGAKPGEIFFTAGGSEANNLAILGTAGQNKGHIITSALEHDSVLKPINHLKQQGYKTTEIKPLKNGVVDPGAVKKAINDETFLVSIMHANNEIGTVQPIKEIAGVIKQIKSSRGKTGNKIPLYLHTDACQAANYLDLHVNSLGVDLMTINGGKIYGPKQSGVLFVKSQVDIQPIIFGGGQELGLRSGTENVAGFVGLAKALDTAQAIKHNEVKRLKKLQKYFFDELKQAIPLAIINGSQSKRLPNNIHITLPGQDSERLIFGLDEKGFQCATGAACSASKQEPSHVLTSIGKTDEQARSSLRITMGRPTTQQNIDEFIKALQTCLD